MESSSADSPGYHVALRSLIRSNPGVPVPRSADIPRRPKQIHFTILASMNGLIARKILNDEGLEPNLAFTDGEVNKLLEK